MGNKGRGRKSDGIGDEKSDVSHTRLNPHPNLKTLPKPFKIPIQIPNVNNTITILKPISRPYHEDIADGYRYLIEKELLFPDIGQVLLVILDLIEFPIFIRYCFYY